MEDGAAVAMSPKYVSAKDRGPVLARPVASSGRMKVWNVAPRILRTGWTSSDGCSSNVCVT